MEIVSKIPWFSRKRGRWGCGFLRITAYSVGCSTTRADRSAAYAMVGMAVSGVELFYRILSLWWWEILTLNGSPPTESIGAATQDD